MPERQASGFRDKGFHEVGKELEEGVGEDGSRGRLARRLEKKASEREECHAAQLAVTSLRDGAFSSTTAWRGMLGQMSRASWPGRWAVVTDAEALDTALRLARGTYQRAVVVGTESSSGSTLQDRGIGATFRKMYEARLLQFLRRLADAGVSVTGLPTTIPPVLVAIRERRRTRYIERVLHLSSQTTRRGRRGRDPALLLFDAATNARMLDCPADAVHAYAVAADAFEERGLDHAAAEARYWARESALHPRRPSVCPFGSAFEVPRMRSVRLLRLAEQREAWARRTDEERASEQRAWEALHRRRDVGRRA